MATFMMKTLKLSREFQRGMQEINYSLDDIRDYILNGKKIPEDLKEKVDYLQKIRSTAIAGEMYYLQARAAEEGIELPADFLDGTALDPILEPEMYELSENFAVFELFLWFNPDEVARFVPRKIIK